MCDFMVAIQNVSTYQKDWSPFLEASFYTHNHLMGMKWGGGRGRKIKGRGGEGNQNEKTKKFEKEKEAAILINVSMHDIKVSDILLTWSWTIWKEKAGLWAAEFLKKRKKRRGGAILIIKNMQFKQSNETFDLIFFFFK